MTASEAIELPAAPLPAIDEETARAIEAVALGANDRYLHELIERHAFCPFARGGRAAGETSRYVHWADSRSTDALVERLRLVADDPKQVVAQVIFPALEVAPEAWVRFVDRLTALGHARRGGPTALAFAALHPRLAYSDRNPFALIPLFRRAPDPTIQWVRLDTLAEVYAGREADARYVDPRDVLAFVRDHPSPKTPLYERIAETNDRVAHEIGLERVEAQLAEIAEQARRDYERVLREHGIARGG